MNWLTIIKNILGKFWTLVFGEPKFTHGVENLGALLGKGQQVQHDKWVAGKFASDGRRFSSRMPFLIYLLKAKTTTDPITQETVLESCVVHPAVSLDDVLNGNNGWDDRQAGGYVVQSRFDITVPHHMSDHVIDFNKTLFNDVDYTWIDGAFCFYFNPANLNLPEVSVTSPDGTLYIYWKIFGWADAEDSIKDDISAFEYPDLNKYSSTVWNIHQTGATYYNVKQLLADVTGSVVARNNGVVKWIWIEQDTRCMLVDEQVYTAPATVICNVSVGDNINKGDILFGTLKMLASSDIPSTGVPVSLYPGIYVRTDVGTLIANNATMQCVKYNDDVTDTRYILPLVTSNGNISENYVNLCRAHIADTGCPEFKVLSSENPFTYIFKVLRKGCGVLASLVIDPSMPITSALDCIRKSISASSMLVVYMQATSDTVNTATMAFSAEAGNAAVAEVVSLKVKEMFASAEVCI